MSEPRRQHYVPKVYLKNFSFKKKRQYKVYVLDKMSQKIFEANIEDIAVEKDFYKVEQLEDVYVWEKYYSRTIEPLMQNIIIELRNRCENNLISDRANMLSDEVRIKLAIIMIFQLLRGKSGRKYLSEYVEETLPQIKDTIKRTLNENGIKKLDKELEDYQISEDTCKAIMMEAITDVERFSDIINAMVNRSWIIYRIAGSKKFITSDNPVMFMNKKTVDVTPFCNGLKNISTVTYYPISSQLLVATYSYNDYLGALRELDGKLVFLDTKKEERFINLINQKQVEQCDRQAFSKDRNDLIF